MLTLKCTITFLIIILLVKQSQERENFTYELTDYFYIPANQSTIAQNTINTRTDQYLSSGDISLTTNLTQFPASATYNLLYFNMSNTTDLSCYTNWLQGKQIQNAVPCAEIIDTTGQCVNYTGCKEQKIYFQYSLRQELYHLSSLVYIQNNNPDTGIVIYSQTTVKIVASNIWFYIGIAFICLLLLNIVILTGVSFYWHLKFKRTQKKYEQFKLTGQDDIKNQ